MILLTILFWIVILYAFFRNIVFPKPDPIDDRIILRGLLEEMEEEAKAYEEAERQQQHWEMLQKQQRDRRTLRERGMLRAYEDVEKKRNKRGKKR